MEHKTFHLSSTQFFFSCLKFFECAYNLTQSYVVPEIKLNSMPYYFNMCLPQGQNLFCSIVSVDEKN